MSEGKAQNLRESLEEMRDGGVSLFLDGKPATPQEIAAKCQEETEVYMPDYVLDNHGNLQELRYEKVSVW